MQGTVTVEVEDRNDVVQYRMEARDSSGQIVNRVHPGDAIDVYVFAKDNSGLATEGIVWARAAVYVRLPAS